MIKTDALLILWLVGWMILLHPVHPAYGQTKASTVGDGLRGLEERDELDESCATKIIQAVPFVSVPVSQLSLDDVTLHVETGFFTLSVPLHTAQGSMERVYIGARTLDAAATYMRFLQGGTLRAVKVEPYALTFHPDASKLPEEVQRACVHEQLKEFLERCTHCRIRELVFRGKVE
ncbi:MAG: hypothetical protein Q8N04_07815 [Nitrospira sp.]|nr:hypothetical protein [Nitrospira sp.]